MMASLFSFLVVFVVISVSSASPASNQRRKKEQVVDFHMNITEGGIGYNERIEVDLEKQTELFQVPSHPGVDRSDVLHDFKNNLTILRFPESKICYLLPLVKRQSKPEKLIKDLKRAQKMVIKETRRLYSSWVMDEEVIDRSSLGEELNEYCAQYTIYHVTEKRERATAGQIGRTSPNRVRRQPGSGLNGAKLCRGGMDLNSALQVCPEPKKKCNETLTCSQINRCEHSRRRRSPFFPGLFGGGPSWGNWNCFGVHDTRIIIECCNYVCDNVDKPTTESIENIGSEVLQGRI